MIQRGFWWGWGWDLSWIAVTAFGARQLNKPAVLNWAEPVYDAFVAGAWFLFWTPKTLFWVAKPLVHIEKLSNGRRLHNETYAAIESDVENLYFWHGVLVPAFVVTRPEWITVKHIEQEENAEVRRVMIERYGLARYIVDSGAKEVAADDFGVLYRKDLTGDEPIVMVKVVNSTAEPDGTFKDYFLRVHPELLPLPPGHWPVEKKRAWLTKQVPQQLTPLNAIASTWGRRGEVYQPAVET
jgi:hypothetical protein